MRRVFLVVVLVVALFSVVSLAKPYTLVPWQYGVIVLVQTPSVDQQQIIDQATQAVQDVFLFWNLPAPTPGYDWATPPQTDSQVYNTAQLNMIMQTPSLVFEKALGLTQSPSQAIQETNPFLSPWEAEHGIAFPGRDEQHLMLIPCPLWRGWKIMPFTIGIFPSQAFDSVLAHGSCKCA